MKRSQKSATDQHGNQDGRFRILPRSVWNFAACDSQDCPEIQSKEENPRPRFSNGIITLCESCLDVRLRHMVRTGEARQKWGMDTSSKSMYYYFRTNGMDDENAQVEHFKHESGVPQ